jgi:hypothetical protein
MTIERREDPAAEYWRLPRRDGVTLSDSIHPSG